MVFPIRNYRPESILKYVDTVIRKPHLKNQVKVCIIGDSLHVEIDDEDKSFNEEFAKEFLDKIDYQYLIKDIYHRAENNLGITRSESQILYADLLPWHYAYNLRIINSNGEHRFENTEDVPELYLRFRLYINPNFSKPEEYFFDMLKMEGLISDEFK